MERLRWQDRSEPSRIAEPEEVPPPDQFMANAVFEKTKRDEGPHRPLRTIIALQNRLSERLTVSRQPHVIESAVPAVPE